MEHTTYALFLTIYLAHLLADFSFQSDKIIASKKTGQIRGYALHGVVHYTTALLLVLAVNFTVFKTFRFQWVVASLCLVHILLDLAKQKVTAAGWVSDSVWTFTADQGIHLATIAVAVFLIRRPPLQILVDYLHGGRAHQNRILLIAVIYTLVIFGGGYFIRYLLAPLWKAAEKESAGDPDEVANAGLYIGWLERFLVLTAVFLQSPAAAGLIIAAKSIARYPEMKATTRFVEYFLIGTLLSITIAIGGAMLLLKCLHGTVTLSK